MRYAVITEETGSIDNVVEWDGVSLWDPGSEYRIVDDSDAEYEVAGTLTTEGVYTPPEAE